MRGFSKAIIAGNLTRDPELRTTPNGASVCGFTVAVNRVYKDASGEKREDVSFIDCSAWGALGKMIADYAKKGTSVLVSGRLDQRSWDDKETGKKRSRVEIVVEDFNFAGTANNGNNYSSANGSDAGLADGSGDIIPEDIPEEPISMDDIPF